MNNKYNVFAATLSIICFGILNHTASAAIPDENGMFTGCMSKSGILRLIDTAKAKCSKVEKLVTWSQGQDVPVGGPRIIDANGKLVGSLIQHTDGFTQSQVFVNVAGIAINNDYYYVPVSEDGFENSSSSPFPDKNGLMTTWRYYESSDCTGKYFLMSDKSGDSKYFRNHKGNENNFVHDNKLYEYDAGKALIDNVDIKINSAINDYVTGYGAGCNSWSFPDLRSFFPHDAITEIADLSMFEPPFTLVVD